MRDFCQLFKNEALTQGAQLPAMSTFHSVHNGGHGLTKDERTKPMPCSPCCQFVRIRGQ